MSYILIIIKLKLKWKEYEIEIYPNGTVSSNFQNVLGSQSSKIIDLIKIRFNLF